MKRWLAATPERRARVVWRRLSGRALQRLVRVTFAPLILSRLPAAAGPTVGVTFDDGPHPGNTERILEALSAAGARATFFVRGAAVERHPDLVQAIVAGGHEVANHGYAHLAADEATSEAYIADVDRCQRLLGALIGAARTPWFRPPYGGLRPRTFVQLHRAGYRFALWSLDSRDSYTSSARQVVANVVAGPVRARDVVLLHEDRAATVEALPTLLRHVRDQGLRATTLTAAAGMAAAPSPRAVTGEQKA